MNKPTDDKDQAALADSPSNSELIRRCNPTTGIYNPDKCSECGNTTFTLKIENTCCGIIYCCTQCGYAHTHWFEV